MRLDMYKFLLSRCLINSRRAPKWLDRIAFTGVNPKTFLKKHEKIYPEFWFIVTVLSLNEKAAAFQC